VKGYFHPAGPGDVPLEVARLLETVSAAMDYAAAKRNGVTP
jgi:hypothetical protein